MFSPPDYSAIQNFVRPRLGPWTVYLYLHRKGILTSLQKALPRLKGVLLDVGCGNKPYASVLQCDRHLGIDVAISPHDHSRFDYTFDGLNIPLENESFDSAICTEVMEHCTNPDKLINEMQRILRKGGYAFVSVPMFIQHHEAPYDFRRFTYYGMRKMAEENGFGIEFIDDRGNFFSVMVASFYITISQLISRRPFSDLVYWVIFPLTYLILMADKKKKKLSPQKEKRQGHRIYTKSEF